MVDLTKLGKQVQRASNTLMRYPHVRSGGGVTDRNAQIMTWRTPNGCTIQMYINPENLSIRESKHITQTRTKGGFAIQYWGENLTQLTLTGTTGSSGIKGINILRNIYRSENKNFDLVAQQQQNDIEESRDAVNPSATDSSTMLTRVASTVQRRNFLLRPSLASMAVSVILFYQGVQYKGFFTEFQTVESIEKLGLFTYTITFMATETLGERKNFMPWHKEPMADDMAGLLINKVGNYFRSMASLTAQPPETFHPENAPGTFGGNSVAAMMFGAAGASENRSIFI